MNSQTAGDRHPRLSAAQDLPGEIDWRAIERSADFRELVRRRRRFTVPAAVVFFSSMVAFLLLMALADDFMGSQIVDGLPLAWVGAAFQVFLTWAVTWLYLRKADRDWEPLARRAAAHATAVVSATERRTDERLAPSATRVR